MFDLEEELRRLRDALRAGNVDYALCGGLALGIHGHPRATIDIDLLIQPDDYPHVEAIGAALGFSIKARPMSFSRGATEIRRISKIDPADGEVLILDLLLVTTAIRDVWVSRERVMWKDAELYVVSREGLVALKLLRSSDQDLVDIKKLRNEA